MMYLSYNMATWQCNVMQVSEEPSLRAVETAAEGSRPRELFEDELEELEAEYERDKVSCLPCC